MNRGTRVADKGSQREPSCVRLSEHTQASDFSGETVRRITKAALGGLAGCALVLGGMASASGASRCSTYEWEISKDSSRSFTHRRICRETTEPHATDFTFDTAQGDASLTSKVPHLLADHESKASTAPHRSVIRISSTRHWLALATQLWQYRGVTAVSLPDRVGGSAAAQPGGLM